MSIQQPDDLFHAIVTLVNCSPLNVTILVYTQNQPVPIYVAWFHENNHINITGNKNPATIPHSSTMMTYTKSDSACDK